MFTFQIMSCNGPFGVTFNFILVVYTYSTVVYTYSTHLYTL